MKKFLIKKKVGIIDAIIYYIVIYNLDNYVGVIIINYHNYLLFLFKKYIEDINVEDI